ncbi:DNA polymerase III subunit gamma/tau [Mycoplasma corogypsi]|uniref:DNA polymerase III subunit gamma/tau n=1 Tax=Mycoplasma corogypsi TaxID=2106 RepID=UPI0038732D33
MSYKVLYRKYRPTRFSEVVGQEHIVKALKNIILSYKIGHAYLFSGPKGTGKTTMAKIFANVVNCMHQNDAEACDNCHSKINNNIDVIEMDAASNNGVDDIRDLVEKVAQVPMNSRYKVIIIDEVHMLSKAAFNALLKTMEEPPAHVVFILATTDAHKIPNTILSRVQKFNFKRMNEKEIVGHLEKILDLEGIQYDLSVLPSIARLASGGMRDALSIADQAISFQNGTITQSNLFENFGITSTEQIIELINFISTGNIPKILTTIDKYSNQGIDPILLCNNIVLLLKDWIVLFKTNNPQLLNFASVNQIQQLKLNLALALEISASMYELLGNIAKIDQPFEMLSISLLKLMRNVANLTYEESQAKLGVNQSQQPVVESVNNVISAPVSHFENELTKTDEHFDVQNSQYFTKEANPSNQNTENTFVNDFEPTYEEDVNQVPLETVDANSFENQKVEPNEGFEISSDIFSQSNSQDFDYREYQTDLFDLDTNKTELEKDEKVKLFELIANQMKDENLKNKCNYQNKMLKQAAVHLAKSSPKNSSKYNLAKMIIGLRIAWISDDNLILLVNNSNEIQIYERLNNKEEFQELLTEFFGKKMNIIAWDENLKNEFKQYM